MIIHDLKHPTISFKSGIDLAKIKLRSMSMYQNYQMKIQKHYDTLHK